MGDSWVIPSVTSLTERSVCTSSTMYLEAQYVKVVKSLGEASSIYFCETFNLFFKCFQH